MRVLVAGVELGIELVRAMANAANTLVYQAPNSDQGQIDLANQIVSDYPASDPNVTGVGGTSLTTGADGAYQGETAWNGSGTSCAAPMWAGFTALFDAKAGANLGNGNAKFYAIGASDKNNSTAFHDVTSGANGGFQAGTGYDDVTVTGWGSYDGAGLAGALG
jgi:subtilase family serine protease